jgi:hypothetical protein
MSDAIPDIVGDQLPASIPTEVEQLPIRYILTSHSIDNTFDYCPRKFEFLNVWDRRPKRDSGFAADVGTALHEGFQAWLIARAEGQSEESATTAAFMALLKWYPWEDEKKQTQNTRNYDRTIMLLYELIRSSEWDNWDLMYVDGKGWAVEIPFLIKHTSLGIFQIKDTGEWAMLATQGKIDFILRNRLTGAIRTWDLKTTINAIEMARSEYTYSGQQVGYSHVLHAMLGIAPNDFSVHYMIARFNAYDPPQIQPFTIDKSPDDIDDYWLAKLDRLWRMKAYAEQGWFPRTNGGCHSWGKECSCFDICATRDAKLIQKWFSDVGAEPQQGYDYWVELEV